MIYCNFTKSRAAEDMVKSFTLLWNLNPTWRVFDHARPDPRNPLYIRMDPETGYRSDTMLRFMADHGYKTELTPPRDKHAGGIAERMVGIVTAKTNNAMLENGAPPSFWCWAMFKTTQDFNFNYSKKIDTSPYNFITGHHIDIKYLERINEFGLVEYWNDVTGHGHLSWASVMGINQMHFYMVMSSFLMNITIVTLVPKSFVKAVVQPDWHPPIIKELDNICENTCFQWIKDTGQRRLFMI